MVLQSSWIVMAHGDTREGKWKRNWRMEWVASTLHTTSKHCVSSITTADAHTSAASSRLNWRSSRFKWTRPFRRKTKSGFCACAITFQLASNFKPDFANVCRTVQRAYTGARKCACTKTDSITISYVDVLSDIFRQQGSCFEATCSLKTELCYSDNFVSLDQMYRLYLQMRFRSNVVCCNTNTGK